MAISDLGNKVENGGITAKGKLSAAEWNAFISELIAELNRRIVSVILNGVNHAPDSQGRVDLGQIQIDVDTALSTTSSNPVRNSVITNAINTLQSDKATVADLQAAVASLNTLQATVGTKIGYLAYENGQIVSYDQEGGTRLGAISLSGTIYALTLSSATPSTFYVLRDATTAYVDVTPSTKAGTIGQSELVDYDEDYTWELAVDNGNGTFVTKTSGVCVSGDTIRVNVRTYLTVGSNRIKFTVSGDSSGQTKTITFNAAVTSLSLTSNFSWQTPWIGGQAFAVDKLNFSGNLQKTLHVRIDDDDEQEYTQVFTAGTNYVTSAYSYDLTDKFPGTTGIHTIEVWMTGDQVETQHYKYNVMCVEAADAATAQLVCINEVVSAAVNYEEQTLFKYALYGSNAATITITVTDGETTHVIAAGEELEVEAQTQQSYVKVLEIESENMNMEMAINIVTGESGQSVTIPVDNSHSYAAVEGATVYVNAAYRSNESADRETIINEAADAPVAEYEAAWQNFAWATDGWATDPDGNRCLVVNAGSTVAVPGITLTQASTQSMTYEFKFRCSNIADYDTPILSLMSTSEYGNSTTGIILFPTKIMVLGSENRDKVVQSVNLYEDSILHVVVVFQRAYAQTAFNLCHIYVNGIRQAVFMYDGGGTFGMGSLRMGQESSDLYLYMLRIYEKPLEDNDVLTNLLNQLSSNSTDMSRSGVRDDNNIIDNGQIDYELAKAAGYNCMIVEMADGAYLPDLDHQNGGNSTLTLEYADHPAWNVRIENAPISGQGTTSMRYYRWNLRWKLKDAAVFTYADGTSETKKGYLDGGQHPKVSKITAKKNVASSMQGHKMGATAMYDDLYAALGLKETVGLSESARVAVYQYPFLGFQKFSDGTYSFIGLYTCGPDKGDSGTFGYDKSAYPSFLSLEGPNHNPLGTRFLHPWVDMVYDSSEETLTYGGVEGWDVDACKFETDKAEDNANIMNLLTAEWKPAYDIVYFCSPYLRSLSEIGMTLQQLNAQADTWRGLSTVLVTRKNEVLQLYDASYNLIYYRQKTGQYEVLSGHNMLSYLSDYLDSAQPSTSELIAARKAKFRAEAGNYWDVNGSCFHEAYCELIGAKDNHAKNSYPFKLATLANGGRWTWREDDLDSIMATDNNGQSTAHYGIEVGDLTGEGVDIFQGSSSVFWTLINDVFSDVVGTVLGRMLSALRTMATDMGIGGNNLHEAVFNMFAYYFWERSAKYFPVMAYAHDSRFAYVDVWLMGVNAGTPGKTYNNVFPLNQALGTQLEAEKQWVERRIVNLCSKYSLGGFTGSDDDGLGRLEFTPSVPFTFSLVPAIEMYPAGNLGGGSNVKGARTKEGMTCLLTASSTGDTTFYLKALDWLTDLGDISGLVLTSRAGGTISFAVSSKRLRRLKVGDAVASNVLFNSPTLSVSGQSFEVVDARNVVSLNSAVSLANCPRLKKAYFAGSGATSLLLPAGGKVDYVSFPSSMTTLILNQLPLLEEENMVIPAAAMGTIRNFYFRTCANIDAFSLLRNILSTEGNSLHFITLIWSGTLEGTAADLDLLRSIKQPYSVDGGVETGYGYVTYNNGQITSESDGGANLQGTLHVTGFYYGDVLEEVEAAFPNLTIVCDESPYIRFEDAEVERICSENWGNYTEIVTVDNGDDTVTVTTNFVRMNNTTVASRTQESVVTRAKTEDDVAGTVKEKEGITYAQAAAVSSLGTEFQEGHFTSFKECVYFTGAIDINAFANTVFDGTVVWPNNVKNTQIAYRIQNFRCKKLIISEGFSGTFHVYNFYNANVSIIVFPSTIPIIPNVSKANYKDTCKLVINGSNIIPIVTQSYYRPTYNIFAYVPDELVNEYKNEESWQTNFNIDKILPLSEYVED